MKSAWLCIWVVLGAAEVGLTLCFHSATFLEIGAVVPAMIAFNVLRARIGPGSSAHASVKVIQPTPVIG